MDVEETEGTRWREISDKRIFGSMNSGAFIMVYEFSSFFEQNIRTSTAVTDTECRCIYRPETT